MCLVVGWTLVPVIEAAGADEVESVQGVDADDRQPAVDPENRSTPVARAWDRADVRQGIIGERSVVDATRWSGKAEN